jgi:type 1 fimbriae regulatory protein FimE
VNLKHRPREYPTVKEVEVLMEAVRKRGRHGHRDATMILIAFRHGLRPSEVCTLRWDMVDLARGLVHVRRHLRQARHRDCARTQSLSEIETAGNN